MRVPCLKASDSGEVVTHRFANHLLGASISVKIRVKRESTIHLIMGQKRGGLKRVYHYLNGEVRDFEMIQICIMSKARDLLSWIENQRKKEEHLIVVFPLLLEALQHFDFDTFFGMLPES
jgi:hypothetical protein